MQASLEQLLLDKKFPPVAIELWSNFVQHVLTMYWKAIDELLTPARWEEFKQAKGALGTEKKHKGQMVRIPTEDGITAAIGGLTNELYKALPIEHFLRVNSVKFEIEVPVYSNKRTGRHSKRIDLRAVAMSVNAPSIAIEAKPILSANDIEKRYLGEEGIGCFFTDDSPYTTGKLGGMFAYTINSTKNSMMGSIDSAVKKYKPNAESIGNVKVNNVDILWSHHDRAKHKLQPITILHLERIFPEDILPTCSESIPQNVGAKAKIPKAIRTKRNFNISPRVKK